MTKARDLANSADVFDTVSTTELGYLDGVSSAIQTQIDGKVASSLVDAKGDLLVASADNTVSRLAVGTNNYVLTADSAEASGIKWAAAAAGGKVLQVVTAVKSDTASSTSTTLIGTGLSASITPSATSSKILVLATFSFGANQTLTQVTFGLYRGATQIFLGDSAGSRQRSSGTTNIFNQNYLDTNTLTFLDSPSTTSSTTYEVYYRSESGATVYLNRTTSDGDASWVSRSASSITLLEIGA